MNVDKPEYASVNLIEYIPLETYCIVYRSNKKKTSVSYEIHVEDTYKIKVFYREESEKIIVDKKGNKEIRKIENNNGGKIPLFKRIQFRQLTKSIIKQRVI